MEAFKESKTALVADVDCTAGGKTLCNDNGVRGYPTIKYGSPDNLEDYKGGRDYKSLKEFADKNLGPSCGPNNLDLCDEETKSTIKKFQAMPAADLEKEIAENEAAMEKVEKDFKAFVEGLNKQYQDESKKKDDAVAEIKGGGLGLMKAVKAAAAKGGKSEL
jgi:hypothetical protein